MNFISTEEQYKKFPDLKRDEVQKILDWTNKQPHLPKITGMKSDLSDGIREKPQL